MATRFYIPATPGEIAYSIFSNMKIARAFQVDGGHRSEPRTIGREALHVLSHQERRPVADDIVAEVYPVIAWRITPMDDIRAFEHPDTAADVSEFIVPVLFDYERMALLWHVMPNGHLRRTGGPVTVEDHLVPSLEDAKDIVLREAQRAWDDRHSTS